MSGRWTFRGIELELRNALEPWHVLGEEQAAGGTVRYVDSSVERVQARVSGWVDERYVLACNGAAVPLTRTDREGEYVGGVRNIRGASSESATTSPAQPAQSPFSSAQGGLGGRVRLRDLVYGHGSWT